ncbi:hypothetical protein NSP_3280 [Nodularia spumigena CCY9414]|nr:hypothetical protein NSP_3280 [Nodularia spumigena CCY9414]
MACVVANYIRPKLLKHPLSPPRRTLFVQVSNAQDLSDENV